MKLNRKVPVIFREYRGRNDCPAFLYTSYSPLIEKGVRTFQRSSVGYYLLGRLFVFSSRSSFHPSVSRRPFFSSSFSSSPPLPPLHLVPTFSSALPSPTLEPLKWQSFLRRRPVEAKRGERSTGSSLDALRFSYAATSRVSGSTEGTRRMNITGWTVCSAS